jgi:hypothetical protein
VVATHRLRNRHLANRYLANVVKYIRSPTHHRPLLSLFFTTLPKSTADHLVRARDTASRGRPRPSGHEEVGACPNSSFERAGAGRLRAPGREEVGVSGCERAGARRFRPPGRRCWAAPAASAQVLGDLREPIPLPRSPAIRGKEDFWARARWATRSRRSLPPMGVIPRPGATDASMRRASEARRRLGGSSASTRRRGARDISKLRFLIFPRLS